MEQSLRPDTGCVHVSSKVPYDFAVFLSCPLHVLLRREGWVITMKETRFIYNELAIHRQPIRASPIAARMSFRHSRKHAVALDFSRPGNPTDNGLIEAFNSKLRVECLNAHWFLTLEDAREKLENWLRHYNEDCPPSASSC